MTTIRKSCQEIAIISITVLVTLTNSSPNLNEIESFDFVIVGAGSAGCILASRLSEDNNVSVLLLEAGGEPPKMSRSAGLFPLQYFRSYDWKYFTSKQKNTLLGRYWPRGRMLGGSGSMNLAIFLRGNRRDFEQWETEGCPNWSWEENLPYYKRVETTFIPNADANLHGRSGPVKVTLSGLNDSTINQFIDAAKAYGLPYRDLNDGQQNGVYHMPVNIYKNERQSSYTNYLRPVINSRRNLRVEKFAFVEQILFDAKTATGVLYSKSGKQFTVKANKEVILCGGTINTPHLLMLSGIGPKQHLQTFGIKVISDLPVGQNLAEEYATITLHGPHLSKIFNPSYYTMANAFLTSKYENDTDYPDIQMILMRSWVGTATVVIKLRPESRGQILLKSRNPRVHPKIDFQYLSVGKDLDAFVDGLKKASQIMQQMKVTQIVPPFCLFHASESDDYWRCRIKHTGHSAFHPIGTCKMGNRSSKQSVVDCHLKVIGINNLRIVDASIFPTPVNANPQATVFMVAEKAADLIKEQNKNN